MKEWIKIFVRIFVVVIGLIGNLCSFVFFMRKNNKLNFYVLMIMLSVYNILMILMDLLIFSVPLVNYYHYVIIAAYSLLEIGVTGSIYSTIAISAERYLVVCHPFYADSNKKWSPRRQIILVTTFSLIYNIPTIFELQTFRCENEQIETSSVQCESLASIRSGFVPEMQKCSNETVFIVPTNLRCNKHFFLIYHIGLDLCFKCVIPFFTLVALNCVIILTLAKNQAYLSDLADRRRSTIFSINNKIHSEINENPTSSSLQVERRETERHEIRLAVTNLVIVLIFIVCHSVIWIPKIYEAIMGTNTDIKRVFDGFKLGYFFTALNSSINCYVYFFTHHDPVEYFKFCLRSLFQRLFLP